MSKRKSLYIRGAIKDIHNKKLRYTIRNLPITRYLKNLLIKVLINENPDYLTNPTPKVYKLLFSIGNKTPQIIKIVNKKYDNAKDIVNKFFIYCYNTGLTLEKISEYITNFLIIVKYDLDSYIDFRYFLTLVKKGKNIKLIIEITKKFKAFKLEENTQGDIQEIFNLINISEEDIIKLVDVMIKSKIIGYPLKQKDLIKFYDANRPLSEDLYDLLEAYTIYHKYSILKNIEIKFEDFIHLININRKPKKFMINLLRILANKIDISYSEFLHLYIEQEKLSQLITLYITAKKYKADLEISFKELLNNFHLGIDSVKMLKIWLNLQRIGIDTTINKIKNFIIVKGNDKELLRAYLFSKNSIPNLIDYIIALYKNTEKKEEVKPQLFVFAVSKAKALKEKKINIFENGTSPEEKILEDYIAGYNVSSIINHIQFAHEKGITISYPLAKLLSKQPEGIKQAIHNALVPKKLHCEHPVRVTTKDHIEIEADIYIEALLNINNYFIGIDKNLLCQIIHTFFIEEVQKKDGYQEVLKSINEIAENILHHIEKFKIEHYTKKQEVKNTKKIERTEAGERKENNETKTSSQKTVYLLDVSKWKPHKIIIPRIDFIEDKFKEIKMIEHKFEHELELHKLEIEKLKTEIEIQKAWAKNNNIKYLILKDEPVNTGHGSHTHQNHSTEHNKQTTKTPTDEHKDKH